MWTPRLLDGQTKILGGTQVEKEVGKSGENQRDHEYYGGKAQVTCGPHPLVAEATAL